MKNENFLKSKAFDICRVILSALLLICAFIPLFSPIAHLITVLSAYAVIAYKTVISAIRDVLKGEFWGENALMILASAGALVLGDYFEAVIIILLFTVGEIFESTAVARSEKRIKALLDLRPDYANKKEGDAVTRVSPEDIKTDEIIIAYPGEKIALDGIVTAGSSFADTKSLTGESEPVSVSVGDTVLCGYINLDGILEIKVTKEFSETTASKVLSAIENAPENHAGSEKFISRFARIYTPIVFLLSVMVAVIPSIITGNWEIWVHRALSLLIVSCPCSLVISVPLAYFCALGNTSANGVLIKGSNILEKLSKLTAVAFDKTGTLTTGEFSLNEICGGNELLKYTAIAESHSPHPVAKAITNAYNKELPEPENYKNLPGLGVKCEIDGKEILVGNEKLLKLSRVSFTPYNSSGVVVYCAVNGEFYGYITASDKAKPEIKESIAELKKLGIKKTFLLSGDKESLTEEIAKECGIDRAYGKILPTDKVRITEQIKEEYGVTAFVGDGMNDAPVLSAADIGIAMGGIGTDAATLCADIVLQNDDISKIPHTVKTAKKTVRIVKENIILSLTFKTAVAVLGILGITGVPLAVAGDVGMLIITVINALRMANKPVK